MSLSFTRVEINRESEMEQFIPSISYLITKFEVTSVKS